MAENLQSVLKLLEQLRPAIERGNRADQVTILRELVAHGAQIGNQWQQLALLAMSNGEPGLARAATDLLCKAMGEGPTAQYQKAALLALIGDWQDADAVIRALPETVPDPASNAYSRGIAALNVGKVEEARANLARATEIQPSAGRAWLALGMATDFSREPQLAERLAAAERTILDLRPPDQVPYYYALGKSLADVGEHARAFAAFSRGARLAKSTVTYDRDADRAAAAKAIEGHDAERLALIAKETREPSRRTVFVTGLPRSGTSLTAQILANHSAVSGSGEIGRLHLLAGEVGGTDHSSLLRFTQAGGATRVAPLWNHWLDELFPTAGRVIDKTVDASRYLGLVAGLLPDAPIIWMTRDPLDCAWSCFRTNFAETSVPWSYDLEDIAAHFRIEAEQLTRWQDILGDRLLTIPYEGLVSDPDTWIRNILAHCGLTEEPQVFTPHKNTMPVATASMAQVRRPIYRDSIGGAQPYREFLAPFSEALRD